MKLEMIGPAARSTKLSSKLSHYSVRSPQSSRSDRGAGESGNASSAVPRNQLKQNRLAEIRAQLCQPAVEHGRSIIYQGDCLELMRKLPSESIDLTVTSPPYNIGKEYESKQDLDNYIAWCEAWIAEVFRVTAPQGAFWLNIGYLEYPGRAKALPIAYLLWDRIPFFIVQEVVWNYGAGVAAKRFFSPRNEKLLWCVKDPDKYVFNLDEVRDKNVKYPNQKKNGKLKCNPLGKNPTDVWQIPKVTSGSGRSSKERTAHPAQFPVALIERVIRASSNQGDLTMDPFMGSGTTAEAALSCNRSVIGFEKRSDYISIARKRVTAYQLAQEELFSPG